MGINTYLCNYTPNTRKAIENGATKEEVMHVLLLTLTTTGFPNMMAAFGWVEEVFQSADE